LTPKSPACIHRILDGHIQEFVLTEVSRRAVDELFDMTENALQGALENQISDLVQPVLIDSAVGLQPINQSITRLCAMIQRFPSRKAGRIAMILPASPLARTIAMMMRPIAPMRIYMPNERDAALAWLREAVEASAH
jgi:hypothetical protein